MRLFLLLPLLWGSASAADAQSLDIGQELQAIRSFAPIGGGEDWQGYESAPFEALLLESDREVLLCRTSAPAGFTADGRDEATGCPRYVRTRSSLPLGLLAAMPIFGPPSTIVMGTPEATGRNLARWRSTLLHEHFHQWQASLPNYHARTAALDLAGGDETGMWMLNFAFPYDAPVVTAAYGRAARALLAAVEARGQRSFSRRLKTYLAARRRLAAAAGEQNWRYLELQLWQEGVARWAELRQAGRHPDPDVRADAALHEREMLERLRTATLAEDKRLIAYPFGMAEAMLLEACSPHWRLRYPDALALGPRFDEAEERCAR